jgi:predicted tellurium resistance membrane protein TerC
VVADVSMSLDNVLVVAGAARDHFSVLVIGLILSIALMGLCGEPHRPLLSPPPLDRLCRSADHFMSRST